MGFWGDRGSWTGAGIGLMMNARDTIVAVSSTVGAGGRVIVRVSGDLARAIAGGLVVEEMRGGALGAGASDALPRLGGSSAVLTRVWPGVLGWVYVFVGPRSYTGEDVVEFHLPGSAVVARMVLDEVVRRGARQAEAGEFTARAYFNGRMDLTQAEGVAAAIGAQGERELRAARQLLGGELARRLGPVMDTVAEALSLVEVGIDFSDEDVTVISAEDVRARCAAAGAMLGEILAESGRFERLGHEPRVVLVGRPNAGKSTLLNRLAGAERAVVSEVAGTTRDAIWAAVRLRRGVVRVVDVAGLQDAGAPSPGPDKDPAAWIEEQMRGQALREAHEGEVVVLVQDATDARPAVEIGRGADLVVINKVDLLAGRSAGGVLGWPAIVSAKTGEGLDGLRERLDELAFGSESAGTGLALNARHVRGIEEARRALERANDATRAGAEIAAMELREALDALGGVLGAVSADDVLGRVFAAFCIGK